MADPHVINFDDDNVFQADLTVKQARDLIDDLAGYDDLASELDEAQGKVFGNTASDAIAYLVITIIK